MIKMEIEDDDSNNEIEYCKVECTSPIIGEDSTENAMNILPLNTREKYEFTYKQFMKWHVENNEDSSFSEKVLMTYFGELSNKFKPNTLWSTYSMLRSTLHINKNVNIAQYVKLKAFLKRKADGYKPKKSETLTAENIEQFLKQAPDKKYLLYKVIIIVGISGGCRKNEILQIKMNDIEDFGTGVLIKIPDTKTNIKRNFTLTGKFYEIFKKYAALRPPNISEFRFFMNYYDGKCIRQPVGINKIASTPKMIATYLGLENPGLFTGHCYRRCSGTILVDSGGEITSLKRHGGWSSNAIAESYIDNSVSHKINIGNTVVTINTIAETMQHSATQNISDISITQEEYTANSGPNLTLNNCNNITINISNNKSLTIKRENEDD